MGRRISQWRLVRFVSRLHKLVAPNDARARLLVQRLDRDDLAVTCAPDEKRAGRSAFSDCDDDKAWET